MRAASGAALTLWTAACADSPSGSADGGCRTLRLQVGEAADVEPSAACPLRAEGGTEYVLAYYDAQLAMGAQSEPEPYFGFDERFVILANDVTGPARASLLPAPSLNRVPDAAPADFQLSTATGGPARLRGMSDTGPWAVGDVVHYRRNDCATAECPPPLEARVARVFDNWLVFAVAPSVDAEAERVVAMFDQYAPVLLQHGLPVMHAAFTAQRPVTSAQSGQLVMVFEGDVTSVDGNAYSEVRPEGTATHWVRLETSAQLDGAGLLALMAHEIGHTFQAEFLARTPPLAGMRGARGAARWGIEGGATLVESETLRRAAGVPLLGNVDYGAAPPSEVASYLYRRTGARDGSLTTGYYVTAAFLRDLAVRRITAGDGEDAAFREVLRGAVEGWYGVAIEGGRRPGLVERMRSRFPQWNPTDAVLTWTLSSAADDRVASAVFRDPTWLRTGDWEHQGRGWENEGLIQAGSGGSARVTHLVGSSGYLLVRAPAAEVELQLTAPGTVRFKLLRVS
jgi:hypothetical protein